MPFSFKRLNLCAKVRSFQRQNQQDSINREKELIKKIDEILQKIQIKKEKLLNNKINANSRYDK